MTTVFRSAITAKGNSSFSSVSQEAADKAAQALDDDFCVDCIDCIDCIDCENCVGCIQCMECFDSVGCKQCSLCVNCENCIECHDCMDLIDCRNMADRYPDTAEPSTKKA